MRRPKERWAPVPIARYRDSYEVSDRGNLRSLPREVAYTAGNYTGVGKPRYTATKFLPGKPIAASGGQAWLWQGGRKEWVTVRSLVLAAFGPEAAEKLDGRRGRKGVVK